MYTTGIYVLSTLLVEMALQGSFLTLPQRTDQNAPRHVDVWWRGRWRPHWCAIKEDAFTGCCHQVYYLTVYWLLLYTIIIYVTLSIITMITMIVTIIIIIIIISRSSSSCYCCCCCCTIFSNLFFNLILLQNGTHLLLICLPSLF